MLTLRYRILLVLPVLVYSLEKGDTCTTPNGEKATCIPLSSCTVLQLSSLNNSITEFILESVCDDFNDELLVCCGSTNFHTSVDVEPLKHKLLPEKCGFQNIEYTIGGEVTQLTENPWLALLGYRNATNKQSTGFRCGGTIISRRYVLTAAHCIVPKGNSDIKLEKVRLGEWKISTDLDCEGEFGFGEGRYCADPVVDISVERTIAHTNYRRENGDNNIGLVRLESDIQFTDCIAPICLPSFQSPVLNKNSYLTISGWGSTDKTSTSDLKLSSLRLVLIAYDKCKKDIGDRALVSYKQICAEGDPGKDICKGDSGGPLMLRNKMWYQVGINTWDGECEPSRPRVYTRVSKYVNWILDNISES